MAATSGTTAQGAILLLAYTLGLGLPFIGIALVYDRAPRLVRPLVRHGQDGLAHRRASSSRSSASRWCSTCCRSCRATSRSTRPSEVSERPEFTHQRERHGLIGPFSGRQILAAFLAIVTAGIVLVGITTPIGTTAGPGARRPAGDAVRHRLADRRGCARATSPRSSRSRCPTARPTSSRTSTGSRSGSPTCAARSSGSTSGRAGARRASTRRRSCASSSERYKDRGLEVVGVSVQETTADDVKAYADRYDLPYTIGFDGFGHVFHAYQVFALPTQFFIDTNGVIRQVANGPVDEAAARGADRIDAAAGVERRAVRERLASRARAPARRARSGSGPGRGPARPIGVLRLVREHDQPALVGGLGEQLGLAHDRVEREVVERGHPARVGRPGAHEQVAEERQGPARRRRSPRTTIAWWPVEWPPVGTTVTPGMSSCSPSAQPCAPQSWTSVQLGLHVRGDEPRVVAERDLPLRLLGDDRRVREGLARRRRAAGRRRGRNGGGSWPRRRRSRAGSRRSPARARSTGPRSRASPGSSRRRRSPMPVSTSTRPAGVSMSRQLSAWRSRCLSSISSVTRSPQRTRGTGPNSVPASERKVPAWISATLRAAAEVGPPVDRVVQGHRTLIGRRPSGLRRSPGGRPRRSAPSGPGSATAARATRTAARPRDDILKNEIWPMRMP